MRIHLRSMRSFHRHMSLPTALSPPTARRPQEATAVPSPRFSSAKCRVWGVHDTRGRPCRAARRLASKMGPARTAKTPALGLGLAPRWAQSPAANTSLWLTLCSVAPTVTQPAASVAMPLALSQGGAVPSVHQTQAPLSSTRPSARVTASWVIATTAEWVYTSTWRARRAAEMRERAPMLWVGSTSPLVTRLTARGPADLEAEAMASASSTPPAPPPTTVTRPGEAAGRDTSCCASCVHLAAKPSIGFTATACCAAPTTEFTAGVIPTSSDSRSYPKGGRPPSRATHLRSSTRAVADAWTSRTCAQAQRRTRSTWASLWV